MCSAGRGRAAAHHTCARQELPSKGNPMCWACLTRCLLLQSPARGMQGLQWLPVPPSYGHSCAGLRCGRCPASSLLGRAALLVVAPKRPHVTAEGRGGLSGNAGCAGGANPSGVISIVISPAACNSPTLPMKKGTISTTRPYDRGFRTGGVREVSTPLISPERDAKVGKAQAHRCAGGGRSRVAVWAKQLSSWVAPAYPSAWGCSPQGRTLHAPAEHPLAVGAVASTPPAPATAGAGWAPGDGHQGHPATQAGHGAVSCRCPSCPRWG